MRESWQWERSSQRLSSSGQLTSMAVKTGSSDTMPASVSAALFTTHVFHQDSQFLSICLSVYLSVCQIWWSTVFLTLRPIYLESIATYHKACLASLVGQKINSRFKWRSLNTAWQNQIGNFLVEAGLVTTTHGYVSHMIGEYTYMCISQMVKVTSFDPQCSPERRPGNFCLPPVWNLRAASLIQLFYISSLVLLPSPVAISVLPFSAFGPFSWSVFP